MKEAFEIAAAGLACFRWDRRRHHAGTAVLHGKGAGGSYSIRGLRAWGSGDFQLPTFSGRGQDSAEKTKGLGSESEALRM